MVSTTLNSRNVRPNVLNAGLSFFIDCVVNLFILGGILIAVYNFPEELVYGRILPAGAVAILAGNLLLVWNAREREKITGNSHMTSIPIGLDITTTISMAYLVMGPAFEANRLSMGDQDAAIFAWKIGMGITLWIGVVKLLLASIGTSIQNILPNSAVLGTLSGIAVTWMGAEVLLGIFEMPEIGLLSLSIMIFALMAGHRLPCNFPGAIAAVIVGTSAFYILDYFDLNSSNSLPDVTALSFQLPVPGFAALSEALSGSSLKYFGLVIPLALLATIGAINVVRAASIVGDDYDTKRVIQLDAITTIISSLSGGVVQTVAYLGHQTYKRMGAESSYAIFASSLIFVLSIIGAIAFATSYIPDAVLKAILLVIAGDAIRVAILAVKPEYGPSYMFGIIPAVFSIAYSKAEQVYSKANEVVSSLGGDLAQLLDANFVSSYMLLGMLSRGYILTGLVWATIVAYVIERKLISAAVASASCAVFSLFGFIHSVLPSSEIYLPWRLSDLDGVETLPWRFATAYLIMTFLFVGLSLTDRKVRDSSSADTAWIKSPRFQMKWFKRSE